MTYDDLVTQSSKMFARRIDAQIAANESVIADPIEIIYDVAVCSMPDKPDEILKIAISNSQLCSAAVSFDKRLTVTLENVAYEVVIEALENDLMALWKTQLEPAWRMRDRQRLRSSS